MRITITNRRGDQIIFYKPILKGAFYETIKTSGYSETWNGIDRDHVAFIVGYCRKRGHKIETEKLW